MTETGRQGPPRAPGRARRQGRGTASVDAPDMRLRKDEFEVRPQSGGPSTVALARAAPLALVAIAATALQARTVSATAALITVAVAVPLLVVAFMLSKRGVKVDRLYMTPTVVGEVNPLTGRTKEVDRAAIARAVTVSVRPIAPPYFDYLLFIDGGGRCLMRVDISDYDLLKVDEFVRALAVPLEDPPIMKAKAVYRKWPGSIPWVLGRAGVAAALLSLFLIIGMFVVIAITGGSGSG
jgi:hypothetical protein